VSIYSYAIASGHDATSLDNVEDVISHAPMSEPLEWGSVERRVLSQAVQYNGTVSAEWTWSAISRADFDTLLSYLGSDPTVGSAPVTITTRDPLDNFTTYNATMVNPLSKKGWKRAIGGHGAAEPLTIEFIIIEQAAEYSELLMESGFNLLLETGDNILLE
jgi:hypothetical protein